MGSRPCESRNDLLNRWVRMKREEREEKSWEKPQDPGTVQSLAVCERWRKRVCEDIDKKLERLYNEPLPEAETRFLNDEVNQILREIRRWEIRIVELGGIDYSRVGHTTPGGDVLSTDDNQYRYFGRARDLPGLRELLDAERQQKKEFASMRTRANKRALMDSVGPDYYGLYDDADLVAEEAQFEAEHAVDRGEPVIEAGPIPTEERVREAVNAVLSGAREQVSIDC